MDDDGLMRQVANGDRLAFGQIVRSHQLSLTRFARRILDEGNADEANDAVQEAFLRLWAARAAYQPEGCLRSYLYRIVRNVCLDHGRRTRFLASVNTALEPTARACGTVEASYESQALAEAVRDAVQELPEPQRIVFVLSQYEQLGYKQIAEIIACPLGTVASRKRLAVETLRRKLAAWMDGNHDL